MCQISLCNLGEQALNKKLFLLMGHEGSPIHDDGWGLSNSSGEIWKCSLPMFSTSDSGEILKGFDTGKTPLLGHIRQASPKVPVMKQNSHPFKQKGISFVHNGKLSPKDEKNFVMEEEVVEIDSKTKEKKTVKVNRSDSLIFFEEFMKHYKGEDSFVKALQETMELFTGKFALVFVVNGKYYIARGRTADLYISYLMDRSDKEEKVIGWAINTSKDVLDKSLLLLSNLQQLDGKKPLDFTIPKILEEETIYKADKNGLEVVGEIKENSAPATTYNYGQYNNWQKGNTGASNPTKPTTETTTEIDKDTAKMFARIYDFLRGSSLSTQDLQFIFDKMYSASILEVTKPMLEHFIKVVIPRIDNKTNKDIRKRLRKILGGHYLMHYQYRDDMEYPWMFNPKSVQIEFVEQLEAKKAKG